MNGKKKDKTIGRREFLKAVGTSVVGLSTPSLQKSAMPAILPRAQQIGAYESCRIVVFGPDGLRIDSAIKMRQEGARALSEINPPILSSSGGLSCTQPGWATIFSGLPSERIKCWSNKRFRAMPCDYHIVKKVTTAFENRDLFLVWITGKGHNIMGFKEGSPHYAVYKLIVEEGHPGSYHGDETREDDEVFNLALPALQEAVTHQNFLCFVHFRNPDSTGHRVTRDETEDDFEIYMQSARQVDDYIYELMKLLPDDTNIVYCSDHGFDFKSIGEPRNGHKFAPHGMLAVNFETMVKSEVSQLSIGRLIYKLAGGNPDWTSDKNGTLYRMFGEDLV
jgi:hypothetical protein